ncbi:MAG: hypothetical protein C5B49_15075 [Bdellovibrio sp.]|nr:MAG: hypothetical protein C5B49_15075 [Bdellovibrio sp.]
MGKPEARGTGELAVAHRFFRVLMLSLFLHASSDAGATFQCNVERPERIRFDSMPMSYSLSEETDPRLFFIDDLDKFYKCLADSRVDNFLREKAKKNPVLYRGRPLDPEILKTRIETLFTIADFSLDYKKETFPSCAGQSSLFNGFHLMPAYFGRDDRSGLYRKIIEQAWGAEMALRRFSSCGTQSCELAAILELRQARLSLATIELPRLLGGYLRYRRQYSDPANSSRTELYEKFCRDEECRRLIRETDLSPYLDDGAEAGRARRESIATLGGLFEDLRPAIEQARSVRVSTTLFGGEFLGYRGLPGFRCVVDKEKYESVVHQALEGFVSLRDEFRFVITGSGILPLMLPSTPLYQYLNIDHYDEIKNGLEEILRNDFLSPSYFCSLTLPAERNLFRLDFEKMLDESIAILDDRMIQLVADFTAGASSGGTTRRLRSEYDMFQRMWSLNSRDSMEVLLFLASGGKPTGLLSPSDQLAMQELTTSHKIQTDAVVDRICQMHNWRRQSTTLEDKVGRAVESGLMAIFGSSLLMQRPTELFEKPPHFLSVAEDFVLNTKAAKFLATQWGRFQTAGTVAGVALTAEVGFSLFNAHRSAEVEEEDFLIHLIHSVDDEGLDEESVRRLYARLESAMQNYYSAKVSFAETALFVAGGAAVPLASVLEKVNFYGIGLLFKAGCGYAQIFSGLEHLNRLLKSNSAIRNTQAFREAIGGIATQLGCPNAPAR